MKQKEQGAEGARVLMQQGGEYTCWAWCAPQWAKNPEGSCAGAAWAAPPRGRRAVREEGCDRGRTNLWHHQIRCRGCILCALREGGAGAGQASHVGWAAHASKPMPLQAAIQTRESAAACSSSAAPAATKYTSPRCRLRAWPPERRRRPPCCTSTSSGPSAAGSSSAVPAGGV